jgi:hypothetical protein
MDLGSIKIIEKFMKNGSLFKIWCELLEGCFINFINFNEKFYISVLLNKFYNFRETVTFMNLWTWALVFSRIFQLLRFLSGSEGMSHGGQINSQDNGFIDLFDAFFSVFHKFTLSLFLIFFINFYSYSIILQFDFNKIYWNYR